MAHPHGQEGLGLELHADTCWDSCLDEAPRISVEVGWGYGADEMEELVPWGLAPQEQVQVQGTEDGDEMPNMQLYARPL